MSAGYTTGGGGYTTDVTSGVPESPGDKSASKAGSDFASAFKRWRKWRRKSSGGGKTVIASGGGNGLAASRTSLGAGFGSGVGVDGGTGMEGLPMVSLVYLSSFFSFLCVQGGRGHVAGVVHERATNADTWARTLHFIAGYNP